MKNIIHLLLCFSLYSFSAVLTASEEFELDELLENPVESKPASLKLYVFDCGEILARQKSMFNPELPDGLQVTLSDTCYLIQHPEGTLMWDTGLSDNILNIPGGVNAGGGVFNTSVSKTLISQLDEIGIDPLSVDYIAFSHLHFDHNGNARYFQNATWLIQKPEYEVAFSPQAECLAFNPDDYLSLRDNSTIQLDGHYDVFGDGSVVILSTAGHTPGHQNLFLNLAETGPIILSGDLYHFEDNRNDYAVPIFNTSKKQTIHSFVLIDNVLENIKVKLWIQHDRPFFNSLNLSPAFYQ